MVKLGSLTTPGEEPPEYSTCEVLEPPQLPSRSNDGQVPELPSKDVSHSLPSQLLCVRPESRPRISPGITCRLLMQEPPACLSAHGLHPPTLGLSSCRSRDMRRGRYLKGSMCCAKLLLSCLTLCDPMDHSLPGSSVHGLLQERILEWVAIPFSKTLHGWALRTGVL